MIASLQRDLTGHYVTHSIGAQSYCQFDKRMFYKTGLALDAHYAVLIHNHPSGDSNPSPEDHAVITEIQCGLAEIGTMQLLDFIIISPNKQHWSWFEDNDGQGYEEGALKGG